MSSEADMVRMAMVAEINHEPGSREYLESKYGRVYDTAEMQKEFEVTSFAAPFVIVIRKSDGERGTLTFQHKPRFYFDFTIVK